jgi:hypothetical protein
LVAVRYAINPHLYLEGRVMTSPYIEALLTERAGYIARGKKDRVKAVDEALREIGYDSKYIVEEKEVA